MIQFLKDDGDFGGFKWPERPIKWLRWIRQNELSDQNIRNYRQLVKEHR